MDTHVSVNPLCSVRPLCAAGFITVKTAQRAFYWVFTVKKAVAIFAVQNIKDDMYFGLIIDGPL